MLGFATLLYAVKLCFVVLNYVILHFIALRCASYVTSPTESLHGDFLTRAFNEFTHYYYYYYYYYYLDCLDCFRKNLKRFIPSSLWV